MESHFPRTTLYKPLPRKLELVNSRTDGVTSNVPLLIMPRPPWDASVCPSLDPLSASRLQGSTTGQVMHGAETTAQLQRMATNSFDVVADANPLQGPLHIGSVQRSMNSSPADAPETTSPLNVSVATTPLSALEPATPVSQPVATSLVLRSTSSSPLETAQCTSPHYGIIPTEDNGGLCVKAEEGKRNEGTVCFHNRCLDAVEKNVPATNSLFEKANEEYPQQNGLTLKKGFLCGPLGCVSSGLSSKRITLFPE